MMMMGWTGFLDGTTSGGKPTTWMLWITIVRAGLTSCSTRRCQGAEPSQDKTSCSSACPRRGRGNSTPTGSVVARTRFFVFLFRLYIFYNTDILSIETISCGRARTMSSCLQLDLTLLVFPLLRNLALFRCDLGR